MRHKGKELTPDIRARLCELKSIGWSVTMIHKRYPHIPYSTIQSTITREASRKNQESSPRSGRPRKITPEEEKQLLELLAQDRPITNRELSEAVKSGPSIRTVQRLLRTLKMQRKGTATAKAKGCQRPETEAESTPENAQ